MGQFDRPLTSLAKSSKARLGEIIIAPPTGPRRVLEPKKVDFWKSTNYWSAIFSKALKEGGGGGAFTVLQEM